MAHRQDWIPTGVKEFDDFQSNYMTLTLANEGPWVLNSTKMSDLKALATKYNGYYAISKLSATANELDYENTDGARIIYIKGLRVFTKQEVKNNSNMTDTNRDSIHVPNDKTTHTDAPVETDGPAIWFDNGHHALLFIHFGAFASKTKSEAKPSGQAEMVMSYDFYKVGDPVTPLSKCTHSTAFTRSAGHLDTTEAQFGMMMVCYGYWKNTANKMSPPSIGYPVLIT